MKKSNLFRIILTRLGLSFSSILLSVNSAQAASVFWDLDFFDESGIEVGAGEFSYDPDTTVNISFDTIEGDETPESPSNIEVNTTLESFTANIKGNSITLELFDPLSENTFWNLNSDVATQQSYPIYFVDGLRGACRGPFSRDLRRTWSSSDLAVCEGTRFNMSGTSTTKTGQGDWFIDRFTPVDAPPDTFPPFVDPIRTIEDQGFWTAELREVVDPLSTPESSSNVSLVILFSLGLFTFSRFKASS